MSVMRLTAKLTPMPMNSPAYNYDFMNYHLGCCGEYEDRNLGQLPIGAQAGLTVAAGAASFIPVVGPVIGGAIALFSKLFGKSSPVYPPRPVRASSTLQTMANVLSRFPPELESYVMGKLNTLFNTGLQGCGEDLETVLLASPQNVVSAFSVLPSEPFMKKAAIRGMENYKAKARSISDASLTDSEWNQVYNTFGFNFIVNTARAYECSIAQAAEQYDYPAGAMREAIMKTPEVQSLIAQSQAQSSGIVYCDAAGNQYFATYPDVKASSLYGVNPRGAYDHYLRHGMSEGRTWNSALCSSGQAQVASDCNPVNITKLFQTELGRTPNQTEIDGWLKYCAGMTLAQMVTAIRTFPEFTQKQTGLTISQPPVAIATPIAQATPSGQTTIISSGGSNPPSWFTPTQDGQAIVPQPLQAGIMSGSALGWLVLGGLFLIPLLSKGSGRKRPARRRYAKGTTVTRRY